MIFDRPSTRTRVSFDVAMRDLGGETIMLTGTEMQLGRGESIPDTARVLSRYVDAIMIRILDHRRPRRAGALRHRAGHQRPHQAVASLPGDGRPDDVRGAPRPDQAAARSPGAATTTTCCRRGSTPPQRFGFQLDIACPKELQPPPERIAAAKAGGADVILREDPEAAVAGAAAVISDCWVSMGDEKESRRRHNLLAPYQVNRELMRRAAPDAIFMHCLPAHRGEEVTDEVMDGPQSVVFDEAENRLHAQKGVLAWCLGALDG